MSNVPKLRFKEFSGEWENKNLGDVFNIFQGYAFSSNDTTKEGVRWLKIADVGIQEMKYDTPSFLPDDFREKHSKFLLKKDDYVLALTRPILNGKLKIAKVDVTYNGSLLNQRVGKLITKQSLDFVYCLLQKSNLINKIDSFILGSEPPNLSVNQIKPIKVQVPSKQEQEKIASFLTSVDTKIEQLTKKEELLSSYKKGVMQKIFNGEIGFKADDGNKFCEWEEKKIEEVTQCLDNKRKPLNESERNQMKGNIPYYGANGIVDYVNGYLFEEPLVLLAEDGGNFFEFNTKPIAQKIDGKTWVNNHAHILKAKENALITDFLFYSLVHKDITKYIVGGSRAKLNKSDLLSIKIGLPCLEEQTKIANFLSSIDSKIEQLQKQLNSTKEFKKALLQQMFV